MSLSSGQILAADPDNNMARVNIGFAHLQKAELDQAERDFRDVLRRDPNSAVAHYDLAVALKQQRRSRRLPRRNCAQAIALDPRLAEAHYTLGIIYWQSGDFDAAAKEMAAAAEISPDYAEAQFMLGTALKQKGDLAGAETALRAAIRLNPADPGPYNTLGQVLQLKGDQAASKEAFAEGAKVKERKEAELGKMLQKK